MTSQYPQQFPPRGPVGGPPPRRRGSMRPPARRNNLKWIIIAVVAVIVLCGFGACVSAVSGNDLSKGASTTSRAKPVDTLRDPVLTGKVTTVDRAGITVEVAQFKTVTVRLALLGVSNRCSGLNFAEAQFQKTVELLPAGATVTVVRTTAKGSTLLDNTGFVHLTAADQPVDASPAGPSVNEQIIAAGAAFVEPAIQRRADSPPADTQLAGLKATVPAAFGAYFDALAAADIKAWEERIGAIGDCRDNIEEADRKQDETRRKIYGPDGLPNTADDPKRTTPDTSNGGNSGSHGGGGWTCRRSRFC